MEQDSFAGFAQMSPKDNQSNDTRVLNAHRYCESFKRQNSTKVRKEHASVARPANSTRYNSCDPKFVQLDPRRRRPAFLRRKKYHDADFHITRRSRPLPAYFAR